MLAQRDRAAFRRIRKLVNPKSILDNIVCLKKQDTQPLIITSANLDRFFEIYPLADSKEIFYVSIIEISTSPQQRCYTTL